MEALLVFLAVYDFGWEGAVCRAGGALCLAVPGSQGVRAGMVLAGAGCRPYCPLSGAGRGMGISSPCGGRVFSSGDTPVHTQEITHSSFTPVLMLSAARKSLAKFIGCGTLDAA